MTEKRNGDAGGAGRGKPPTEHQWPKGKSGNPKGRPKKSVAEPLDPEITEMILAEGSRTITLTEGGKAVSMPAAQAVFRAMLVAAMKGNSHALRNFVTQVATAQAQQQKRKEEAIATALHVKIELEATRIQWVRDGRNELGMLLHPSDIEIDHVAGEVKYFLAFTGEEQKARAALVNLRDYLLMRVARSLDVAAEDGDDALLQIGRDAARASLLNINQRLPSRFRRVPPGEEPPIGSDSSPEEVWKAIMAPIHRDIVDRLVRGPQATANGNLLSLADESETSSD